MADLRTLFLFVSGFFTVVMVFFKHTCLGLTKSFFPCYLCFCAVSWKPLANTRLVSFYIFYFQLLH